MERRDFLKNSLFSLLGVALTSNKTLASVVENLTPESLKVMLYLVQTNSGEWKVKATKWIDLPKKRLKPCQVKPETFKLLDIVDYDIADNRKIELWKKHNCTGRLTPIRIKENIENGKKAITHPNYLSYRNSDKFKDNMVKLHKIGGVTGGKIAAITKREMGFDYRAASLKGAEVMRNMSIEKRLEYAERAIKTHKGRKRSDEFGKKISELKKGKPSHMKGKTFSNDAKKNMSEGAKNRKYTEEGLIKRKQQFEKVRVKEGFKHSEETKNKIRELKKGNKNCVGRIYSQETINKMSKSLSGKIYPERSISVQCYLYPSMKYFKDYDSLTIASNELKINRECARLTAVGKRNHAGGYTFKYKN